MSLVISTTEEVTEVTTVDEVTTVNVTETPVVVSEQVLGISGPKGDTGATGATGPSGVVSVTAPITNSGTSTAAIIGINAGVANGVATLDGSGLVPTTQLPPLAVNDTFVVGSQAAMLALTAQVGDIAVRTDVTKTFILTASPASTLGNWQEILTPPGVTSVTASSPLTGGTITSTGTIGIQSATTTQAGAVTLATSGSATDRAATPSYVNSVNATLSTHTSSTGTSVHGATSTNTASQIVARDGSGNFSAGTISATALNTTGSSNIATGGGTLTVGSVPSGPGLLKIVGSGTGSSTTIQSLNGNGVTNTLTLPTSTTTLVGRDTTDTLTNKTLTSPVISSITNTGTLTLPTSTGTVALTSQIPAATFPPFVSTTAAGTDQLYKPASPVSTTAFNPGTTTGRTYYLPFYVGVQTTFDRIGFTQSGAGSGNVRLGIYNDGGGYPTTVLVDAQQVAYGTASTTYTATFSTAQTLAVGWYWLAWNRQTGTTGTFFQLVSGNSALGTQPNRLYDPKTAGTFGSYWDTSSGTGAFVNTSLGVLTASGDMPLIYLRAQ